MAYCFISAIVQWPSSFLHSLISLHALVFVSSAKTVILLDRKWPGWTWKNGGVSGYGMSFRLLTARTNLRFTSSPENTMTEKKQRVNTEAAGRKNSGHLRIASNPLDVTPTRYNSLRRFPNGCSVLKAVSQKTCVNVRQRFTEQD